MAASPRRTIAQRLLPFWRRTAAIDGKTAASA
jgi:hypothetical protein